MMLMLMIDHWNIEILFLKEKLFYPKIIFAPIRFYSLLFIHFY